MAVTRPVRTPWASLMQRLRREVVDLHSGEFCVDVSTYGLVEFEPTPREKCDSTFNKVCETKNEQVRQFFQKYYKNPIDIPNFLAP